MRMILSYTSKLLAYQTLQGIENTLQPTTQKVHLFSKRAFINLKNNSSFKKMSYDEFIKYEIGPKKEYDALMKTIFPDASPQELDKWYDTRCRLGYRDYKEDWLRPNHDPGIILTPDFFRKKTDNKTKT